MLSLHHVILPIPCALYAVPGGVSPVTDGGRFLAQAMQDSLAEIESCELALQKTANDDIKSFAEKGARMLASHLDMARDVGKKLHS
ncbi:MAG TPA: DUF4142 domain-containing protein [Noviherbaspirillum sp.]